jgi:hypothetical protein
MLPWSIGHLSIALNLNVTVRHKLVVTAHFGGSRALRKQRRARLEIGFSDPKCGADMR